MKKIVLVAGLLVGVFSFSQKAKFGLKAGLNISNISHFPKAKGKTGMHFGVLVNVPLSKSFSFQPELIYNNIGAKDVEYTFVMPTFFTGGNPNYSTFTLENKLEYISIPMMFQGEVAKDFYLEAGPQVSVLISELAHRMDVAFGVGLGADFTENFGFNVRYTRGMTNLYEEDISKNNNFQIGLNYRFK